jgi:sugar phosphate isomerase/epimerase
MRLGAPVGTCSSPEEWVAQHQQRGYSAAFCPVGAEAPESLIAEYVQAAAEADIVIAEVGAWSNPLSLDPQAAAQARDYCRQQLALAEALGARCCVNIAGSRGEKWDGPHPDNVSRETFDTIVSFVRDLLAEVQPTRTAYTLETMPWVLPDSPESYAELIAAIDHPGFAVHLDPVNLVNCPRCYYDTAGLLRECFRLLGPHIRSCHGKDIALDTRLTVHLDEVAPGEGNLCYATYLQELDRLDPDTPLMLEHLADDTAYTAAAAYVRQIAEQTGVTIR